MLFVLNGLSVRKVSFALTHSFSSNMGLLTSLCSPAYKVEGSKSNTTNRNERKVNVVILGKSQSGKTKLLYDLLLGDDTWSGGRFLSTNSFNYETIKYRYAKQRYFFHIWDLSGRIELQSLWRVFYNGYMKVDVVLFTIDATAPPDDAAEIFKNVLHEETLQSCLFILVITHIHPRTPSWITSANAKQVLGLNKKESERIRIHEKYQRQQFGTQGSEEILKICCKELA